MNDDNYGSRPGETRARKKFDRMVSELVDDAIHYAKTFHCGLSEALKDCAAEWEDLPEGVHEAANERIEDMIQAGFERDQEDAFLETVFRNI